MMDAHLRSKLQIMVVAVLAAAAVAAIGWRLFADHLSSNFRAAVGECIAAFDSFDHDAARSQRERALALIPPLSDGERYKRFLKEEEASIRFLDALGDWLERPVAQIEEWSFTAGDGYVEAYGSMIDNSPDPMICVMEGASTVFKDHRADVMEFRGRPSARMFVRQGDSIVFFERNAIRNDETARLEIRDMLAAFPPSKSGSWSTVDDAAEGTRASYGVKVVYPTSRTLDEFVTARSAGD